MNNKIIIYKPTLISVIIVIIYLIIVWVNKNIIFDVNFYYKIWQNKFSIERIDNLILQNNKLSIFSYLIWPCILYIKWALITFILYITKFIFDILIILKFD